ncbi:mitochondrial dicarboxylate carrier [Tetranychus urticae]|uniref:Mitochondrial dicarboxylate carrier n=1 Tax=Tetranychus urticae TaxID=32264 RepID=T1K0R3_TETUR|nr:mitochondrial dicarboxylate carrier [Tetranychus urticae]
MSERSELKVARWYFGGVASAMAASCTHPLDLLKVHLQTSFAEQGGHVQATLLTTTSSIVRSQGVIALYNGLTACLLRQLTYSTTRFAVYEAIKQRLVTIDPNDPKGIPNMPFYQKVLAAAFSGAVGGFVGTPADMVNVRMQNDIKLPYNERRNYAHAFDGILQVYKREGVSRLFNGATSATSRAALITIGQISMYDQFKYMMMKYAPNVFEDNLNTHFSASFLAGACATTMTQPLDVIKTRMMNAPPGVYRGIAHCAGTVFKECGPLGFFKGYVPAFVRLGPQTVLTFIFFEQLRIRFGKSR